MRTLVIANNCNFARPDSVLLLHLSSISRESRKFLNFEHGQRQLNPKALRFCSFRAFSASKTTCYGGWEDFEVFGDPSDPSQSDQLLGFLSSVGINDKKYVFIFLLGLLCAFSISRVRVSSIVVFPASVLIFAIGFSFGFVRGGSFSAIGGSNRSKEDFASFNPEKLRILVDVLDGLDAKAGNLKNVMQRAIDTGRITVSDLENYVSTIKSMMSSVSGAKNFMQAPSENAGRPHDLSYENPKPSGRRKEAFQFMGGLFGEKEKSISSSHTDANDVKQEIFESLANDRVDGRVSDKQTARSDLLDSDKQTACSDLFEDSSGKDCVDQDISSTSIDLEDGKMGPNLIGRSSHRFTDNEEYYFPNSGNRFVNNPGFSRKMHLEDNGTKLGSSDNLLNSMDLRMETEASFIEEQVIKKSSRMYRKENIKSETSSSRFKKQHESYGEDPLLVTDFSANTSEIGSSSYSEFANDVRFDRYLTESNKLMGEAKEFIRSRHNEEHADKILQTSACLLSEAISLKPMSLVAVRQLGNTYLLHGELKLLVSRELRAFLSRGDSTFFEKRGLDSLSSDKDKIVSRLINVCEECEELLTKAGKNYKLALSIDGDDVRALYNWGLALIFRGQLIANIGPKAAGDADRLYMAAIDKFDAMVSKGNVYVPEALFRWGMALQQRSRLRPSNSKEKYKLLQQARRLYEDALHLDSGILHAEEALSRCIAELDYM